MNDHHPIGHSTKQPETAKRLADDIEYARSLVGKYGKNNHQVVELMEWEWDAVQAILRDYAAVIDSASDI